VCRLPPALHNSLEILFFKNKDDDQALILIEELHSA
jgi:hypothetical protein